MTDETIARRGPFTVGINEDKKPAVFDASGMVESVHSSPFDATARCMRLQHLWTLYQEHQKPIKRAQRLDDERRRRAGEGDLTTWVASKEEPFRIGGHSEDYTDRTPHQFTTKDMYRWIDQHMSKETKQFYKLWGLSLVPTGKPNKKLQRFNEMGKKIGQRILDDMEAYEALLKERGAAAPTYCDWIEQREQETISRVHKVNAMAPRGDLHAKIIECWHTLERKGVKVSNRTTIIWTKLKATNPKLNRSTVSRVTSKIKVCKAKS